MTNPNPKGKITLDSHQNASPNPTILPKSAYCTATYTGPLSKFYENTLTSNLLDHIIDFSISQDSRKAFIRLATPQHMDFFSKYAFIENTEPWNGAVSIREMSISNKYRYFEGRQIRNDEQWVAQRVQLFSGKTGWNIQDLLYREDWYYKRIYESLKQEEAKVVTKIGHMDMSVGNRGEIAIGNEDQEGDDSGLKIILPDNVFELDDIPAGREKNMVFCDRDGDYEEDMGLKCVKKVKLGTEAEENHEIKNSEGSPDTGLEQEGAETSYKEDWKPKDIVRIVKEFKGGDFEEDDEVDIFGNVTIFVATCDFDRLEDDAMDYAWSHKGKGLKDIQAIQVKGDLQTVKMYMDQGITANGGQCSGRLLTETVCNSMEERLSRSILCGDEGVV